MLEHSYECSKCRTLMRSIKMCAGCKVMGYCSKDCQKADWKEHKQICKGAKTGTTAVARNPAIKVAERFAADQDVMAQVDGLLITALDLIHHPENALNYAVGLSCHVESTDVHMARDHIMALMAGRDRPTIPERIPKLFQIGTVARLENQFIPEGLDRIAAAMTKRVQEQGYLCGTSDRQELLVRAMWVAKDVVSTVYFCRLITQEMLDEVAAWKQPDDDGEPTEESPSVEDLVRLFDLRALHDPDMNRKLSIMVATND